MITLEPEDAGHYNFRGYIYREAKQYEEAIADYTKAIEISDFAQVHRILDYERRGDSHRELGNIDLARKDWEKAASLYRRKDYYSLYYSYSIERERIVLEKIQQL